MIGRPKATRSRGPLAHHLERALGHPDRAHRVVDPSWTESLLGNPEPVALVAEKVGRRHADVVVDDLSVATVGSVVVAEQTRGPLDLDPGRVLRHEDHALAPMTLRVRIGHAHDDQQLAARRHRSRCPPFATVDQIVVTVALDPRGDVRRVRGGDFRLGHRKRRSDLALEQRLEPRALLLVGAEQRQQFHVAGVRGGAVDRLGRDPWVASGDLRKRRVLDVGQAGAVFVGAGEEQVPEPAPPGLLLQLLDDRRDTPPVIEGTCLGAERRLSRIHAFVHERHQLLLQLDGGLVVAEVH